jgi:hypothetical protein
MKKEEKMTRTSKLQAVAVLSYLAAGAVALASLGGIFLQRTYVHETPSWAAQGLGQDVVNLVFVVPLLLASIFLLRKGKKVYLFMLGGLLVYVAYSYVLYCFCVHFNRLFFIYCAALGFSVYALVLLGMELQADRVESWFNRKTSTTFPALYFLATTAIFYLLWLTEDVPAVFSGVAPKSLAEAGLFSNPVHVLDLSLVLPAMALASLQLWKKKAFGYLFFPVMMAFAIVMGVAILGMMVALHLRGLTSDTLVVYVFAVLILLNSGVLTYFLRSLK